VVKYRDILYPLAFHAPVMGVPVEVQSVQNAAGRGKADHRRQTSRTTLGERSFSAAGTSFLLQNAWPSEDRSADLV